MKKLLPCLLAFSCNCAISQIQFDPEIDVNFLNDTIIHGNSPLKFQILFIGGHHKVEALDSTGNPIGQALARTQHDYTAFTADTITNSEDLGWVTVSHEIANASNDTLGDGGGMTVFKVKRDTATDTLVVVNQTLPDGRTGKYFNIHFDSVGGTYGNCAGINTPNGRVWTAEERFATSNAAIYSNGNGIQDTSDFIVNSNLFGNFDGDTIKRFECFNWIVEVDPRLAKPIRKQYNWGRMPYEGGTVLADNKTVYIGSDFTPGYLTKFIAETPGDYTKGDLFVYRHDTVGKMVPLNNTNFEAMMHATDSCIKYGSMFNRIEWLAFNKNDGKVYFAETGGDQPGSAFAAIQALGSVIAQHHHDRATAQGVTADSTAYLDRYGRILCLDPANDSISVYLECGPEFTYNPTLSQYPKNHLASPDGLTFLYVNNSTYMVICEDLISGTFGRLPDGVTDVINEVYLLDMALANPTVEDLIRISVVPKGAEVTGVCATPDGKTLFINSMHPDGNTPFPYNKALTYALTGWDKADASGILKPGKEISVFNAYPNPTNGVVRFNGKTDVGVYDVLGKLLFTKKAVYSVDLTNYESGQYYLVNSHKKVVKIVLN